MNKGQYWVVVVEQNGEKAYHRLYQKASAETTFAVSVMDALKEPPFTPVKITLYQYDNRQTRCLVARLHIGSHS